ncbi:MAG: repeat-containing protein [Cytophagaceae bacterium]|jgi:tetratricopeptide (TPR) repeat protein|nr:repeat-containing protein [Cytophagaceae bacterium]
MNRLHIKHSLLFLFVLLGTLTLNAQDVKKGKDLIAKERLNDAKAFFTQQLTADPKNAAVYQFYIGEVYYAQEKYDSAKIQYKLAMTTDDKEALSYAGLGKIVIGKNQVEGQQNFEKALSLANKKSAEVYNVIAGYYIQTGDKKNADAAIALLQTGLKNDPKNFYTNILAGDAYLMKNDGSYAASYFNAAANIEPNNPLTNWRKGNLYANARNYNEAINNYKEGLVKDPEFGPLYREIGEIYYRSKQYKKAIENYQLYLQKIDNNDDAQFRYASFLYLTQDYKTALSIFDQLEQKKFSNPILYRLKAFCLYETGSYDKGLEYLNKFFAVTEPENILAIDYEYLAKFYLKKENDTLAVKNIEFAVLRDSSKAILWNDMGIYYFSKNNYEKSIDAYNKKLEKIKAEDTDYLNVGKAYYFNKKYKEADSVFTYLTVSRPTAHIGFLYRARSNAFIDSDYKTGQAKPFYEKVIELTTVDEVKYKDALIESYQYLATYYLYKKDKVNADIYWNKVLKLDPANKKAQDGLKVK